MPEVASDLNRGRVLVAVQAVGACLVIIATTAMPWATYRVGSSPLTSLHADSLSTLLISMAAISIVIACLQLAWHSHSSAWVAVAVGTFNLALTIAEALGRISDANSVALKSSGGSATSYASGSGIAILGCLAIIAAGLVTATAPVRSK